MPHMKDRGHEYAEYLYYTLSPFDQLGGIWPVRAGQNVAKPNYCVSSRTIQCYSLHFVLSGNVRLSYNDQLETLAKGDLFCLHPHVAYSYWQPGASADPALRMNWLAFEGEQAVPFLEQIGITKNKPYLRKRVTPEMEALMGDILAALRSSDQNGSLPLLSMMYELFVLLARPHRSASSTGKDTEWLQRSIRYLNTRFMEGITVSDAVEMAGVHRSHFYTEFTREFGMSPQRYLMKLRMERAAAMLTNPAFSITEISLSVGYPDLYSFSRAFVKYYGTSPSGFRTRLEKNENS